MGAVLGVGNSSKHRLSGDLSHFAQGLAHGSEAWILKRSARDVVKAYDRNLLGNAPSSFSQSADGANRGNIIESE